MAKAATALWLWIAASVAVLTALPRRTAERIQDKGGRAPYFILLSLFAFGSALALLLLAEFWAPDAAPRLLLAKYGCTGCHQIGGDPSAVGRAGPSLIGMKDRLYLGGAVRNSPAALTQWIMDPTKFAPAAAMPRTGVSEDEARRIAAYLYEQ